VESIEVEPGVTWYVELDVIGEADETGHRRVHMWANGQPWALRVEDTSAPATRAQRRKADASDPSHIATTVPGIVTVLAAEGDAVEAGQVVAVVEAMKMESVVTSPRDGVVNAVHAVSGDQVEAGDLLFEVSST